MTEVRFPEALPGVFNLEEEEKRDHPLSEAFP